jgi:hypothetical protein
MTYVVVDASNKVENLVLWDGNSSWTPPEGTKLIKYDGEVHIGWQWDGSKFYDPNPKPLPPVPPKIEQSGPKVL